MNKSLHYVSLSLSIILGVLIWVRFGDLVISISDFLTERQIFIVWQPGRILYSIGIGLIPIIGLMCTRLIKHSTVSIFLLQTLNVSLGLLFTGLIGYIIARQFGRAPSEFLPDYVTYEPFKGYWNLMLYLGLFFYPAALLIWNVIRKKKAVHNS